MSDADEPVVKYSPASQRRLVIAGYTVALLLPIIGALIGLVLVHRGEVRHGLGVTSLSVVLMAFTLGVLIWLRSLLS